MVRRYFTEVLDGGKAQLLEELCTPGFVQHFPGRDIAGREKCIAGLSRMPSTYESFATTIHAIFGEGDRIAAHITHDVVVRESMVTRIGVHEARGKAITWDAIAIFRFEGERMAEEWIARDDLGMLLQVGVVRGA